MSRVPVLVVCLVLVTGLAGTQTFQAQQAAAAPPQFRAGINLVPLDVRVVDRAGNPIKDLAPSEFSIFEDGVRQELRHFSTADLESAATTPQAAGAPDIPTRRVFLFVLGRGRLEPPAKGAAAAVDFVKRHVLPNDYVAVLAWNRATSFTTDHAKTIEVLERFKRHHERIEQDLRQHFSGLAALYAGPEIPASIQTRIDDVFAESGATVASGVIAQSASGAREARSLRDNMMTNELRALFPDADAKFITPIGEDAEAVRNRQPMGMDLSFDEFVGIERQSTQDVTNLYAGITYMRHLAGEKHLVFITESGTYMPSADDDRGLAAAAADARVAMHIMHTGGTVLTGGGGFTQTSSRVARMTGGSFSSTSMGARFMDRLDRATRFQYVLGYTPANSTFDNRFRRIEVRVTRPDAQVQYRTGYFASRTPVGLTPALVLAQGRIAAGLMAPREVKDLTITSNATTGTHAPTASVVDVEIIVRSPRVALTPTADPAVMRVSLEVAMFIADSRNQIVGQSWRTVTAEMGAEALTRFRTHGMRLTGRVDVTAPGEHLKVVVFDPGADLMGTAVARIQSK